MSDDPTTILGQAQSMARATARADWDAQTRTTDVSGSLAARWRRLTARLTARWTAKPGPDDAKVAGEITIE